MTISTMHSGKLDWCIIKENEYIKVLINQNEFAKLPIHVFPNEQEAINTAKYNIVNEVISNLEITEWGVRKGKKGIHRIPDERSNKPMFTILGEEDI